MLLNSMIPNTRMSYYSNSRRGMLGLRIKDLEAKEEVLA
jgi:hypothetical protein